MNNPTQKHSKSTPPGNVNSPGNAKPLLGINNPAENSTPEWHSRGYLPHRDKISLIQSIIFRLDDSLPQTVLNQIEERLESISCYKGTERRIQSEAYLDAGIGCCALRHPKMAEISQDTFLKFDGDKYSLIAWCIMPNHVHILIEPFISLSRIIQSWKSFTGKWALKYIARLSLAFPGINYGCGITGTDI